MCVRHKMIKLQQERADMTLNIIYVNFRRFKIFFKGRISEKNKYKIDQFESKLNRACGKYESN